LWAWGGSTACSGDGGGTVWSSWSWSWGRPKLVQGGPRRPEMVRLTSATGSQETPELFLQSPLSASTSAKVPPPPSASSPSPLTSTPSLIPRSLALSSMNHRPQPQQQLQLERLRRLSPTLSTPGLSMPPLTGPSTTLTQRYLSTHPPTP